jgi:hypothetical protein
MTSDGLSFFALASLANILPVPSVLRHCTTVFPSLDLTVALTRHCPPRTGEKTKIAREESIRQSQNQAAARNAYSHPDPRDLQHGNASSGLPWGEISIKRVVERGKEREQQSARSREGSVAYGGGPDSRGARDSSAGYFGGERGGRGDSYYGSASAGGGYSAGGEGRGTTAPGDRSYHASSRGRSDYSR